MKITRRKFIETVAIAAPLAGNVLAAGVGEAATSAPARSKIRRGVASYSYQEDFMTRQMSVEDILREMSDIGANGIEVLAEMMVPDFPNPSDAWVDQWHGWVEEYNIEPAAYTQFIDSMRTMSHNLSVEEGVQTMLRDIKLAKRLGIPRIRCLIGTPVPIIEATVPYLEEQGMWMGVELHSPIRIESRLMERFLGIAQKTDHFGFVPDFGIFQNKPNPYARDRQIRDGKLRLETATYIENAWENQVDQGKVSAEVAKMEPGEGPQSYVIQVYRIATQDPRKLLPIMEKCQHIHGKTWGLTEDCVDPAIDLSDVIPTLIEGGYDGVIATEYEGQRHVQDIHPFSAVEMIRRHHVMLSRLLGDV